MAETKAKAKAVEEAKKGGLVELVQRVGRELGLGARADDELRAVATRLHDNWFHAPADLAHLTHDGTPSSLSLSLFLSRLFLTSDRTRTPHTPHTPHIPHTPHTPCGWNADAARLRIPLRLYQEMVRMADAPSPAAAETAAPAASIPRAA